MDAIATRGHVILDDTQVRLRTNEAAQRFTGLFVNGTGRINQKNHLTHEHGLSSGAPPSAKSASAKAGCMAPHARAPRFVFSVFCFRKKCFFGTHTHTLTHICAHTHTHAMRAHTGWGEGELLREAQEQPVDHGQVCDRGPAPQEAPVC